MSDYILFMSGKTWLDLVNRLRFRVSINIYEWDIVCLSDAWSLKISKSDNYLLHEFKFTCKDINTWSKFKTFITTEKLDITWA